MGHVRVTAATVTDDRIAKLTVELIKLGSRSLDRDTAIAWMRDGHSFLPVINGRQGAALQLVSIEDGDEVSYFVRTDNEPIAADTVGDLPTA